MMEQEVRLVKFEATKSRGKVSGLLLLPENARLLLVFAHGAGAGMRHRFMEMVALHLAGHRIASFRYQFPYMEEGGNRPDPKPILLATVRSAIEAGGRLAPDLPVFAGGKSMGGRMTSEAAAERSLDHVLGLVFFGFPLHPAGKPSTERAEHLSLVRVPMLFIQGTRDSLADLDLLRPVCKKLGRKATLHVVDGGDHSFRLPKISGRSEELVLAELAGAVEDWCVGLRG